ncbi:MAG: hypothetical protein NT068_00090 [Candidatus Nomurabacteria bacterium]|nr:hypothetical protein [Candidatus Nomurabacteria bacterium]
MEGNELNTPKPIETKEEPILTKKGMVQTYAEDMAKAAESIQGIELKKLIERDEQFGEQKENLSPESKKNKILMIISTVLMIATVALVFLVYKNTNKIVSVPITQQNKSIIFTDKTQFLPIDTLSKDQIIQTIKNEVLNTDVKNNGVEAIYLTENNKVIGFNRFVSLLQMNVPSEISSYTDDNFLIGAYNGTTKSFFILLKVNSFTDIFPGFKIWENQIFNDLHSLFGIEINVDTKDLLNTSFTDNIVNNKNARTLTDKNGKTILEYVYVNETSVVIIGNDETAVEIMLRLSTGQVGK